MYIQHTQTHAVKRCEIVRSSGQDHQATYLHHCALFQACRLRHGKSRYVLLQPYYNVSLSDHLVYLQAAQVSFTRTYFGAKE